MPSRRTACRRISVQLRPKRSNVCRATASDRSEFILISGKYRTILEEAKLNYDVELVAPDGADTIVETSGTTESSDAPIRVFGLVNCPAPHQWPIIRPPAEHAVR